MLCLTYFGFLTILMLGHLVGRQVPIGEMSKKLSGSWSDGCLESLPKNWLRGVKICNSDEQFFFLIRLTHFQLMAV